MEQALQPTSSTQEDNILRIDAQPYNIVVRVFGDDQPGIPVLLMHGLQSHSGWFVQSAAAVSRAGSPAYIIERRGSGMSEAPRGECNNFHEMLADILSVVKYVKAKHGKNKVHLMGHCFGAIPATNFAIIHGEQLASLILPTPGIHTYSDLTLSDKLQVLLCAMTGAKRYIDMPMEVRQFSEFDEVINFINNDPLSLRQATGQFYYQVLKARQFINKNLSRITLPVLMAFAGKDQICDNNKNRQLFELLPSQDKLLLEYPNAKHVLEFSSHKDEFFNHLAEWLNKHRTA